MGDSLTDTYHCMCSRAEVMDDLADSLRKQGRDELMYFFDLTS